MSIAIMSAAWALEVSATDKIVLLALADHANDQGYCWPGNASLCKKCGLSERAVRNAIRTLEAAGHLTCHFKTGKTTSYHIHPGTTCPRQDMPPAPRAATPAPRAPKSSRTIIPTEATLPTERARAKVGGIVVPDWVPADAWAGFVAMRQRIRKPLTPRAAELLFAKLLRFQSEHGWPPGEVLDQSTEHAWAGIFELKGRDDAVTRHTKPMGGNSGPGGRQYRRNPAREGLERLQAELAG